MQPDLPSPTKHAQTGPSERWREEGLWAQGPGRLPSLSGKYRLPLSSDCQRKKDQQKLHFLSPLIFQDPPRNLLLVEPQQSMFLRVSAQR